MENQANAGLGDLTRREWAVLVPVVLFIVWIGIYPSTFLEKSASSSRLAIQRIDDARRGVYYGLSVRQGASPETRVEAAR